MRPFAVSFAVALATVSPIAIATAGIIIGHPVPTKPAGGGNITFTTAEITVTDQVVYFCGGGSVTIEVDAVLDILSSNTRVLLPTGTICGIDLQTGGAATYLEGQGNGGTFEATLQHNVVHLEVDPPLVVSQSGTSIADEVELGAPGWITASMLGLSTGVHVVVDSQHNLHGPIRDALRDDSIVVQ